MCEMLMDLRRRAPNVNLIMSVEASFHLIGAVNKHNCRIWSEVNPHEFEQYERDSSKVNVWCAVNNNKLHGSFFFAEKQSMEILIETCWNYFLFTVGSRRAIKW